MTNTNTTDTSTEGTDMATNDTDTTDQTANADENGGEYSDLLAEATALLNDEDAWTWMDQDPSVAWDDSESGHGRLAAIYERAGWERCYHDRGTVFHFNVKVNGNAAYQSLHRAVHESGLDYDGVMECVNKLFEDYDNGDMYWFWQDITEDEKVAKAVGPNTLTVWQCGRSGGYLNVDRMFLIDSDVMLALAEHCQINRDWFNGADYGTDLADRAIADYEETKLAELASPRIERIEA